MTPQGRWITVQESEFPHERDALEVLRVGLPDQPPFHAWSNFEFIAQDGSINEIDTLVISPERVYLVEIKNWHGKITGDQSTWNIRINGRDRAEENPLLLANRKAKKLKSLLARQKPFKQFPVPFIQAVVFLSAPGCTVDLDEIVGQHVYQGPSADRKGRHSIVDLIQGNTPGSGQHPTIGRDLERAFCRAMEQLGMRKRSTSAEAGDYRLRTLLSENDRYQDWEAVHKRLESDVKRVRIFSHTQKAADAEKQERKDLALREYRLTGNLDHDGVLKPSQLTETEAGPALIYPLYPEAQRLDLWLQAEGTELSAGERLELLRQIAEALQYAHQHNVCHRALSPWTIHVLRTNENRPRVLLRDWQSGASSDDTRVETRMTVHAGEQSGLLADPRAMVYAAPEVISGQGYDAVSVDIFSLGALTYLLFGGAHPATSIDELIGKVIGTTGLLISEAMDGAPDSLEVLVQLATDPDPAGRPSTVQDFLQLLDDVEEELTAPEEKPGKHPLDAGKGDELSGGFLVLERLGSGSCAVALAVQKGDREGVLKIAKEPSLNERLRTEAKVLADLRHPNIVKCLGETEIDGLAAIFMERAGRKTMDQRLRSEGRLSLDLLERFGDELLTVLVYLEREGINHRDIKPVNIGIGENRKRALTLKLFDFSLSSTPAENILAGTPPYLEPFLRDRKPPRWDLYAERFSAAMTLYELATGVLPEWGREGAGPLTSDEEARLDTELFDPAVRDGLTSFFAKALCRDHRQRFDNADEMHLAWREFFQQIDVPATTETVTGEDNALPDLSTIEGLGFATPLAAFGLTARELNAADRIGATTVKELLGLPQIRLYRNRGLGQKVVGKLRELREALADYLAVQPQAGDEKSQPPEQFSIDRLVNSLTGIKLEAAELDLLTAWLGLAGNAEENEIGRLPTVREAAEATAFERSRSQAVIDKAVEKWNKNAWISVLRDHVAEFIQRKEGIATIEELATHLLAIRGSTVNEGPERMQRAHAVMQAALESEATRESARFTLYRGNKTALAVATESLGAAYQDSPTARAQYAEALAAAATALAQEDPLPLPKRIEEALAAVAAPPVDDGMSADRRLRLAVAAAPEVALSSRAELYPVGLSAERALRMGSNALLGPKRLSVQQLHSRIRSRFLRAEPLPDRPQLDDLLKQAEIPLEWHQRSDDLPAGYAPPQRGTGFTRHTSTLRRSTTFLEGEEASPEVLQAQRFDDLLTRAVRDQRVLIVTCVLPRLEHAAGELARCFGLTTVSLEKMLITAMHEAAAQARADWNIVLAADGAKHDSRDWRQLNALVARVLPKVREELFSMDQPLLIQHVGLLARYGQIGLIQAMRDHAAGVQAPARILLVPGEAHSAPRLDGEVLPVITPADWAHLPKSWLEGMHSQLEGVAS